MTIEVRQLTTEADFEELERDCEARKEAIHKQICSDLKTQNGQATNAPMFCVIEWVKTDTVNIYVMAIQEVFFTHREADQYIEECQYDHESKLSIYVKSGYRNEGWQYARELMLNNGGKD